MKPQKPTPGQVAYEADVTAWPNYHDGTPRKTWDQLDAIAQYSWERDPRPRTYLKNQKGE